MSRKSLADDDPLKTLLKMDVENRIEAIAKDVKSGADVYRRISAFELAHALEVPQPEQPDGDWSFIRYSPRINLEDYVREHAPACEFVYLIETLVDPDRFRELEEKAKPLEDWERPNLDFLTKRERALLEDVIMEEELKLNESIGGNCIAHYCVPSHLLNLRFEAVIEDDGCCIDLRTPYDQRDGRFVDLSNCITDSW